MKWVFYQARSLVSTEAQGLLTFKRWSRLYTEPELGTITHLFRVRSWNNGDRCMPCPLRWRHNDHAGVSNHQPHGCLLNRLFRRKSKKTSKLRVTGLCAGNSPGTGEFPAQMASYAENVSIWWRHHVFCILMVIIESVDVIVPDHATSSACTIQVIQIRQSILLNTFLWIKIISQSGFQKAKADDDVTWSGWRLISRATRLIFQ